MTKDRIQEIYKAVVVNGFYEVGSWGAEPGLSEITHDEMIVLVKLAQQAINFKENS